MKRKSIIDGIYNDGLCIGCGMCESICGKKNVEMKLQTNGFYRPIVKVINGNKENIINKICPGVNIINDIKFGPKQKIWGKVEALYSGYSTDEEVRNIGSSGGVVSGLAIYLLESNAVDAVLQIGGDTNDYTRNSLKISKVKQDVLNCASSRYAPALIFDRIIEILESNSDNYCFIGKPCDVSALKNLINHYPEYQKRFKIFISIVCAGIPSFIGTEKLIESFDAKKPVKNLVYRGNGWPGNFSFKDEGGKKFEKSYNESWGNTLNQYLNFRCKICPDGIGLQADVVVGDAWETKDGYPDFTEKEGLSLVLARTKVGVDVLDSAKQCGKLNIVELEETKVQLMQPYQYVRRKRAGVRALAYMIGKRRLLFYKNLRTLNNILDENPLILIKEFIGTFRRTIKI